MNRDVCAACGKPIYLVKDRWTPGVHLRRAWVHGSRWTRHTPVPKSMLTRGADR